MRNLLQTIENKIITSPYDFRMREDLYFMSKEALETDMPLEITYLRRLSAECDRAMTQEQLSDSQVADLYGLHKRVCLAAAPHDFDSYILYCEWEREPDKKFYLPRRKTLKLLVTCMQDLIDDKLDLLSISLPPGVGKTTLAIFLLTWIAGRLPNEPNLTGSHSNAFIRGVYDECLRILDTNGEYLWHEVFPVRVSRTNAKDCRIDVDKTQRFETLQFTTIGTGNAGLYRASTLLYCDDLVSGLEVALSKERLDKLWEIYTTDLRQRKKGDYTKELHIATRWSVHDVIGRLKAEIKYADIKTSICRFYVALIKNASK